MEQVVEIRSYNLKPGKRDELHQLFVSQAAPMLQRWNVQVVGYGPSPQDSDTYYLIRAYADLNDLQQSQDAFYGSDEWRQGPRQPILALIENFTSIVLTVDEVTLEGLRRSVAN
jgi:hypothetical protein